MPRLQPSSLCQANSVLNSEDGSIECRLQLKCMQALKYGQGMHAWSYHDCEAVEAVHSCSPAQVSYLTEYSSLEQRQTALSVYTHVDLSLQIGGFRVPTADIL